MNPNDPPTFHRLDETAFQELCRDLFEREMGIRTCEIYGVRGQAQLGIDLIAQAGDGSTTEAGQCKCCENFPPAKIREASDEFLRHLEFWRERQVKRFVLIVASPLDRKKQRDEIDKQIKRFAAHGIIYEAWSARTLRTKLHSHPDLVRRYTQSEEWVRHICGSAVGENSAHSEGAAGASHSADEPIIEKELEDLSSFMKLFGFEAKRPKREAVMRFYNSSRNIGRRAIKNAAEYLTEEGERLSVVISKPKHVWNFCLGTMCTLFFLTAIVLSPVWRDIHNSRLSLLLLLYSTISLGMAAVMFGMFNPYVQALRIKRELAKLPKDNQLI